MNIIENNYVMKINMLIDELNKITDNQTFYQQKDYLAGCIIDAVHALADCYERNRDKLFSNDKEFILAFRYLNNQLKHDQDLEVFSQQIYSSELPTYLPFRLGATSYSIIWTDFEDHGRATAEARREHYDEYLNGKDIKDTLTAAKQILNNIVSI